ncbi:MAG: glycosyltransferase family 39 protein [Candidatus Solibacter usitatus]|nr:glycosyltransferase family 39 protein [Candidatus Solibacter usitatus]
MKSTVVEKRWLAMGILILGVAAALRVSAIGERSLSHPEMYVPGLPLPAGLSDPPPRHEFWPLVRDVVATDTHPPGYYAMMWPVIRLAGASEWSMRLPSAVCGVATVGFLMWLGLALGRPGAGLLAGALLALNGYHIFWSQAARMYSLAGMLALLSTLLLLKAAKAERSGWAAAWYCGVTLLGLATHVFMWSLLAAQIGWVAWAGWVRRGGMPGLLKWQWLTATMGTPLLAVAAYQSGNPVATMSRDLLLCGGELMQFGFLWPRVQGRLDTFPPEWLEAQASQSPYSLWWAALLALGLWLVWEARREAGGGPVAWGGHRASPGWRAVTLAAAAATGMDVMLLQAAQTVALKAPAVMRLTTVMAAAPLAGLIGFLILPRVWAWAGERHGSGGSVEEGPGGMRLVWLSAFGPPALLWIFSMAARPVMTPRGLLAVYPLVALLLALGLIEASRDRRWVAAALALALIPIHIWSVREYSRRTMDPLHHKQFVERLRKQMQPSDLVFYPVGWANTPLLWYLPPERYRVIGWEFGAARRKNPDARVWVLSTYGVAPAERMTAAVGGYRRAGAVEAPHARAELFEPARDQER